MVEYDANQMNVSIFFLILSRPDFKMSFLQITEFVLDDLSTLKSTLEELIILKEKFGINLSSTKYLEVQIDISNTKYLFITVSNIKTFFRMSFLTSLSFY